MSKFAENLRRMRQGFCTAVVLAAGTSQRMGQDKLFMSLDGTPVLAFTLTAIQSCPAVDELIVVTREDRFDDVGAMRGRYGLTKLTKLIPGGATRTQSALAGVTAASEHAAVICVHDGARPFPTPELITEAVRAAEAHVAAAPAVPVKDTVKRAENGIVIDTPDRNGLFAVQTPQAFQADIIKAALTKAALEGTVYTDDCAAVEALGVPVYLTQGSEENIKITTPSDLALAETILERRRAQA